jgi:hypothetical protein
MIDDREWRKVGDRPSRVLNFQSFKLRVTKSSDIVAANVPASHHMRNDTSDCSPNVCFSRETMSEQGIISDRAFWQWVVPLEVSPIVGNNPEVMA